MVIPLREQIQQFSTVRDNITALLGPHNTAMMLSQSLFLISVGSNDLFQYQRSTNMPVQEFLDTLQLTYQNHLQVRNKKTKTFFFLNSRLVMIFLGQEIS